MSVLKRTAVVAAASALVVASVGSGGPANAAKIKVKAKVTGTSTIAKTGDKLKLPKGAKLTSNLIIPVGKLRNGVLKVPTITAHMNTSLVDGLPTIPVKAKVNMVQTKKIRGKIIRKGKNKGHLRGVAHTRLAIPHAVLDYPLLNGINIVQDTCTTKPFKIKMLSSKKLQLEKAFRVNTTFTIPEFDGCSIVNAPPLGLRNSLLTQLVSGPGNKLNLKIGPVEADTKR